MLNEFLEVETYLGDPTTEDIRLNHKLLADDFKGKCKLNGIHDILVLIACRYIYDFCKVTELNREVFDKTILILRIWCGFEGDVSSKDLAQAKSENQEWFKSYPYAEGWLRFYHDKYLKEKGASWSVYSIEWKAKLCSKSVYYAESICYENILAQAVARGPLKTYYLVVDKKYDELIQNEVKTDKGKRPDKRRQRNMLKLLGTYKVLQLFHPGQKSVLMQTNRIANWLGLSSVKDDRWCLELRWKNEPIFQKEGFGSYMKFSVNQSFLEMIDLQLMERIEEIDRTKYNVYGDNGHGRSNGLILL